MESAATNIPGVLVLRSRIFRDQRGSFMESFNRLQTACIGINHRFVQDNVSCSAKNVVRGLHFQSKRAQGKLVRVLRGSVYDVAVDIRPDSPTFGRHFGVELRADEGTALWIPPGLAHGFSVISDEAIVLYKTTHYYAPQFEQCLRWDDPGLGIPWPLAGDAVLSPKDAGAMGFAKYCEQLRSGPTAVSKREMVA